MSTKLKVDDLISIAEANITIKDGVAEINNKVIQTECFEKLGTDIATVKKAYDDVALVENTIATAFSDKAQDHMADHKDYDSIVAKTNVGEEEFHLTSRRTMETRNPSNGETMTHKGALTVRRVVKNRSSELSAIKQLAKTRGLNKL